jgi:hypothetical protein
LPIARDIDDMKIYRVGNDTSEMFFESKEDAAYFVGGFTATVGLMIHEVNVMEDSKCRELTASDGEESTDSFDKILKGMGEK